MEEIKSIGQVMQDQNHLLPATQKSEPLKTGALKLLEAIKEKKIAEESIHNLNELFKYCFLLVGLREKSLPNELEALFLHEFIKENHGGHSISEVKLAFTMAVKGQLDLPMEEVKCYENFSVVYLSQIINSFRRWARDEYRQIEKHIPPPEADQKYLEGPRQEIHWGFIIEKEYQHFLSFGDEHWKMFPVGLYEQLVADEIFESEFFRKAMPAVRQMMVGEYQRERVKYEMKKFDGEGENVERAKSITQTNIMEAQKKIDGYQSGDNDSELEVVAKQYCVLQFFKNSKQNMKQHVYVAAE